MWGSEKRLDDYLRGCLQRALDELAAIDADVLLSENVDVLVAALAAKHLPVPVSVDWADPARSPVTEVSAQVRDQFDRDEIYTVPASKVVITFPISGTVEILDHQASTVSMSGCRAKVSGSNVVVEVIERTLTADLIRSRIEGTKSEVDPRASWANADLASFRATVDQAVRNAYANRKERILNDRAVEAALGIPVRTSGAQQLPIAARRKHVSLQVRKAQAGFVPEPVLEEAVYQEVLDAVRSWGTTLERTPKTAAKLEEEELRDLLLGTLNGYWRGAAGGELFNGSGKTDILIREGDRNAFIAECKIWRGPKGIAEALDQLLSYLVWRDSKAALIVFIRTANPNTTIEKLHAAVEAHQSHALTKNASDLSHRADYILTADAEGRRVSVAVLPVLIRSHANDG